MDHSFHKARARYYRRVQLWASARRRLGKDIFYKNRAEVERSVSAQLAVEFPEGG